jgi:hypothetical protein
MLHKVIDDLSKIIEVSEEKKKELYLRYSSMDDKTVIKELSQIVYRKLRNNEELYTSALEIISNINPTICPPVEKMKVLLNKMYSNDVEGNMSMEDNHKLVKESIVYFANLFNQYGIDYYIVGALPCFLKKSIPLFRYHDDIDIMVNEEDIPKVAEIIESSGYIFHDDRFPSLERYHEMEVNHPPHLVLAQNPNNEFHLGFFTFRREKDNSITMTEYSHRLQEGNVEVDVLERRSDPIGTQLRYEEVPTEFMGTSFRTGTVENVYHLKGFTKRPKDYTDMKILEPYMDKQKLEELKKHPLNDVVIENIEKDTIMHM